MFDVLVTVSAIALVAWVSIVVPVVAGAPPAFVLMTAPIGVFAALIIVAMWWEA